MIWCGKNTRWYNTRSRHAIGGAGFEEGLVVEIRRGGFACEDGGEH